MPRVDRNAAYQRIRATVDSIPSGRVATYGQIAHEAGLPGRARQVGFALRHLPTGSTLAWHRVLNARGEISPRGGDGHEDLQRARLIDEGVEFDHRGRVDLRRFAWHPDP